jgi:hypothetical protein
MFITWYHKHLKQYERWIFGVLLALIVIAFVLSGVAGQVNTGGSGADAGGFALETASMKVTRTEFDDLLSRWGRAGIFGQFFQMYGSRIYADQEFFSLSLKVQMARRSGSDLDLGTEKKLAVDAFAIMSAAKEAGLRVTSDEISTHIRQLFGGRSGGFDFKNYEKALLMQGLTPESFEKSVGEFMLVSRYIDLLGDGVDVATEDIFNEYMKVADRGSSKYCFFDSLRFATEARRRITQKELVDALRSSTNSYGYRQEEQGRIEYVIARTDAIKATLPPLTDEEVRKYYDAHRDDFQHPVYGPEPPPGWTPLFDDAEEGTDGDKKPEEGPKPFDRHIPFEECKAKVAEKALESAARDKGTKQINALADRLFKLSMQGKPGDAKSLAAEMGLEHGTTAWFRAGETGVVDDLLGKAEGEIGWDDLLRNKTPKPENNPSVKIRTSLGMAWSRLAESRDPSSYRFSEHVRSRALESHARQGGGRFAKKHADDLRKAYFDEFTAAHAALLQGGKTLTDEDMAKLRFEKFEAVARKQGIELKDLKLTGRDERIDGVPDARVFLEKLLSIDPKSRGEVDVAYGASGSYVLQLVERRPPTADGFSSKRASLRNQILTDRRRKFQSETIAQYKKEHLKVHVEIPKGEFDFE